MSTSWTPGADHGLVWEGGLALISGEVPVTSAVELWRRVRGGVDVGGFLQNLSETANTSLLAMPSFALVLTAADGLHVAVRGDFTVVAQSNSQQDQISAAGVSTWIERSLAEVGSVLVARDVDFDAPTLPLIGGLVPAGALGFGTAPLTGHDVGSSLTAAAAPVQRLDEWLEAEPHVPSHAQETSDMDEAESPNEIVADSPFGPGHADESPEETVLPPVDAGDTRQDSADLDSPEPDSADLYSPDFESHVDLGVDQQAFDLDDSALPDDVASSPEAASPEDSGRSDGLPGPATSLPTLMEYSDEFGNDLSGEMPGVAAEPASNNDISGDFDDQPIIVPPDYVKAEPTPAAAGADRYESLFGATVLHPIEDAAVREEADSSEPTPSPAAPTNLAGLGDFISSVPSAQPVGGGAASGYSPLIDMGDHDGRTIFFNDPGVGSPFAPPSASGSMPKSATETVLGVLCPVGHGNPPHRPTCRVCGAPVSGTPTQMPRPAMGWLRTSSGEAIELVAPVIAGRSPRAERVQGPVLPRLLSLPHGHISGNHVEIRFEGWNVLALDLHSRNGTFLRRRGEPPMRLPEKPLLLVSDDVLDLGRGVQLSFQELP